MTEFTLTFVAQPEHIDGLGHVNNAVWVQWMEAIAIAHWEAVATPAHQVAYAWVVVRHEVDYRGNIRLGESVTAETKVSNTPRGARLNRQVQFRNADGKVIVSATTTWVMIDPTTERIVRILPEVAQPFF